MEITRFKYIFKFRFKKNYFIVQENLESVEDIDADEVILAPEQISADIDITYQQQAHISKKIIVKLVYKNGYSTKGASRYINIRVIINILYRL